MAEIVTLDTQLHAGLGTRPPQRDKMLTLQSGSRWRGKIAVPRRVDPLVARFFELLNKQRATMDEVGMRAGLRRGSISDWRYRRTPQLATFKAALNALGYDLVIVPRKD